MIMTIQKKLIATLKHILGDKKTEIVAIVNLLETEQQKEQMMIYLSENYQDEELMRIDRLLKTALQIAGEE